MYGKSWRIDREGTSGKSGQDNRKVFCIPRRNTYKKDKSVKLALDSQRLNEACIKRKATMLNMEELFSKNSAKTTTSEGEIWMSKIDFDYVYGQAKLSREASKHCVFSIIAGELTGQYCFKKGSYGLSDIPTIFKGTRRQSVEIQNTSLAE